MDLQSPTFEIQLLSCHRFVLITRFRTCVMSRPASPRLNLFEHMSRTQLNEQLHISLTSSCCCHLPIFFRLRFQHTGSWINVSRAAGWNYSLTLASISEKFCWCHRCRQAIQLFFLTDWLHHVVVICQFSFVCAFNTHVRGLICQELQVWISHWHWPPSQKSFVDVNDAVKQFNCSF